VVAERVVVVVEDVVVAVVLFREPVVNGDLNVKRAWEVERRPNDWKKPRCIWGIINEFCVNFLLIFY
jgi:hypothetical protein